MGIEPIAAVTAALEVARVSLRASHVVQAELAAFTQDALATSAEALRDLAACRSLPEFFARHALRTQLAADFWVRQTTRTKDLCIAALPGGLSANTHENPRPDSSG